MTMDLQSPLAVACHDAGATNIILAWLAAADAPDVRLLVGGPASALLARHSPAVRTCDSIEHLLAGAAMLLSGSGWGSDLEHDARRGAKRCGLRSVAVIDHWTNYRERFTRNGETILPDEFWVTDDYAHRIASDCFPGRVVCTQRNLYLEQQLQRVAPLRPDTVELLYVLEPARDDWGRGVPGEFQALDYFLERSALLKLPAETLIRLRPHPSEPPGKYAAWIARQGRSNIVLDDSFDVAAAMSRVAWVAGCETFALVIGLLAGRRAICTLPPWAPACRLPHRELVHLKSLGVAAA